MPEHPCLWTLDAKDSAALVAAVNDNQMEAAMTQYWCYVLNGKGRVNARVNARETLEVSNDNEAFGKAQSYLIQNPSVRTVEVWLENRYEGKVHSHSDNADSNPAPRRIQRSTNLEFGCALLTALRDWHLIVSYFANGIKSMERTENRWGASCSINPKLATGRKTKHSSNGTRL
jgi:hypothetical protein